MADASTTHNFAHSRRLSREARTLVAMIELNCHLQHKQSKGILCHSCAANKDYALRRLQRCVFGEKKPACQNCTVHCYGKTQREEIRQIMKSAGPKMIWHHPWLALGHVFDKIFIPAHELKDFRKKNKRS